MNSHGTPIAGFSPDSAQGYDTLGIESEVKALASLITSRHVETPLSIGLFGTEGSGKSFFSQRVAEWVSQLKWNTREELDSMGYCAEVIQVEYNAWHYMGANQWLGLAEKIFLELDRRQDYTYKSSEHIFDRISTAQKLLRDLESKVKHAASLYAQAEDEVISATAMHEAAVKGYAEQVSQSKWPEVQGRFWERISTNSAAVEVVNAAGYRLGLRELSHYPEQLNQVLEQAKSLSGRAGLITSSLKAKRYVGNAVLILVCLGLIGLGVLGVVKLYVNDPKTWIELLGKSLATISTLLGFFAFVLAAIMRNRASQAIDALQNYESILREVIEEADRAWNYEEAIAKEKVQNAQKEMQDNRAQRADASRNHLLAEQALRDFYAGGVLRRVSEHYRKLIQSSDQDLSASVVPIIREDFQDLSRAINEFRFPNGDGDNLVDRIVVYIDDLDQCPPDVVITVLQAAYLLLASPMFVVVISANPLRLLESLKLQYKEPEGDFESGEAPSRSRTVGAINFLSKLIQIPFWIKPVSQEGAYHLARHLLAPNTAAFFAGPDVESGIPIAVDTAVESPVDTGIPIAVEAPVEPPVKTDPVRMELMTEMEIDFLQKMVTCLRGSPREIKRLINTYRLVRSSVSLDGLDNFLGNDKRPPAYAAVICELAVLIVAPLGSRYFFDFLRDSTFTGFQDFYTSFANTRQMKDSEDWKRIEPVLDAFRFHTSNSETQNETSALQTLSIWRSATARYSFTVPPDLETNGSWLQSA